MAASATITLPVKVTFNGKDTQIGELTLDVKVSPQGRVTAPSAREVKAALRKGLR